MRRILLILVPGLLLCFEGFVLLPPAHRQAFAAERGAIEGRVVDGATDRPVAEVEVTLTSAERGSSETLEMTRTTDRRGRYRFDDLPTGEERFYALDARHGGGLFSGRAITLPSDTARRPVVETTLRVWPTTNDPQVLLIARDDIFVSQSEAGGLGIVESVRINNTSEKAYVGRGGATGSEAGSTASTGFALPPGADNRKVAIVDADIDIPELLSTEYGFAITTAIPPGETRVTFSYPLEGTAGSYDLSRRALYPIVNLAVYATDSLEVNSNRLRFDDSVTLEGGRGYDRYVSEEALDAGDSLQAVAVAEAGIPSGLLTGMAGVLALVVFLGIFPLLRSRRAERKPGKTREQLVEEIARLDLEHEHANLSTEEWAVRRAELKAELATRDTTAPVKERAR